MSYNVNESNIRTIKQDDPEFTITDGYMIACRAGIEFGSHCPSNIEQVLKTALSLGYIKLFACIKDNELMWENLSK